MDNHRPNINPIEILKRWEYVAEEFGAPKQSIRIMLAQPLDWAFVILMHSLVEAALDALMREKMDPRVVQVVQRLPLNNERTGKLAFAASFGLITAKERSFVKEFSLLRNAYVHDIGHLGTTLADMVASLSQDQRLRLRTALLDSVGAEHRAGWEAIIDHEWKGALSGASLIFALTMHARITGEFPLPA